MAVEIPLWDQEPITVHTVHDVLVTAIAEALDGSRQTRTRLTEHGVPIVPAGMQERAFENGLVVWDLGDQLKLNVTESLRHSEKNIKLIRVVLGPHAPSEDWIEQVRELNHRRVLAHAMLERHSTAKSIFDPLNNSTAIFMKSGAYDLYTYHKPRWEQDFHTFLHDAGHLVSYGCSDLADINQYESDALGVFAEALYEVVEALLKNDEMPHNVRELVVHKRVLVDLQGTDEILLECARESLMRNPNGWRDWVDSSDQRSMLIDAVKKILPAESEFWAIARQYNKWNDTME